jgi:hypothetical protein
MKLGRVYPLGPTKRQLVGDTFDKLHTVTQGRMDWANNHSPSGYPVFVAWRTTYKGRVDVDMRNLNKISVPDIYPIPMQSDILPVLANKKFISVVDAMSFFYQCGASIPREGPGLRASAEQEESIDESHRTAGIQANPLKFKLRV